MISFMNDILNDKESVHPSRVQTEFRTYSDEVLNQEVEHSLLLNLTSTSFYVSWKRENFHYFAEKEILYLLWIVLRILYSPIMD